MWLCWSLEDFYRWLLFPELAVIATHNTLAVILKFLLSRGKLGSVGVRENFIMGFCGSRFET